MVNKKQHSIGKNQVPRIMYHSIHVGALNSPNDETGSPCASIAAQGRVLLTNRQMSSVISRSYWCENYSPRALGVKV